jgi:hypothetical protein
VNIRMVIPVQIAVIALALAGYYAYAAVRGPVDQSTGGTLLEAKLDPTQRRIQSKAGGYAILLPPGVVAKKDGLTVEMTTPNTSMVVVASPLFPGPLKPNSEFVVRSIKLSYQKVRILERQEQRVDDRRALATSGRAVNEKKAKIRFVSVVVKAKPRNFAINAFVGYDVPARAVLPTLTAILDGFTVLDQGDA